MVAVALKYSPGEKRNLLERDHTSWWHTENVVFDILEQQNFFHLKLSVDFRSLLQVRQYELVEHSLKVFHSG